ncbi:glycerol-3-phosphate dehydrogenase, partial [Ideonella sp.]|uniref:glycerol-3-phosphate dehydrogenase n=1 Tax=Ideonella sp. TaxID=1929293 RepID=UPI003BB7D6C2
AQRSANGWTVTLSPHGTDDGALGAARAWPRRVQARALVNAAGPWAAQFLQQCALPAASERLSQQSLRLVKGSHIVVPRCFAHEHAYLFQGSDGRVVFAIPYEHDYTLIGTTDEPFDGEPQTAQISLAEAAYLCEQASRFLRHPVTPADVVWHYAGVRPLLDDAHGNPSAVTRDYLLETDTQAAPLLSVWGGKLTTYRTLAESAANTLSALLTAPGEPSPAAWTATVLLPGGDLSAWIGPPQRPDRDFFRFLAAVRLRWPWLPGPLALRLARAYGGRLDRLLDGANSLQALGAEVAPGLFEIELDWLLREEWALTAEDVLWRRSKLGLHLDAAQRLAVQDWLTEAQRTRRLSSR